ncbi:hypothetical protein [Pseudoroseicyclus sp. CXY001]|uniref:hypothetical protein n=1 Tax=Pseudoroseicyclus sp. CXY001 TaxID=3242492 RepID=UPI0035714100
MAQFGIKHLVFGLGLILAAGPIAQSLTATVAPAEEPEETGGQAFAAAEARGLIAIEAEHRVGLDVEALDTARRAPFQHLYGIDAQAGQLTIAATERSALPRIRRAGALSD